MRKGLLALTGFLMCGSVAMAQYEKIYEPITYKGSIPFEVLQSAKDKTDVSVESGDMSLTQKDKQELYTTINFEISEVLLSGSVYFNDEMTAYVTKIVDYLLKDDPEKRAKLKVYVTKFTDLNATCWGDGSIFVNIGLISRMDNEAQLAFVLSHEISHYFSKHTVMQFKKNKEIDQSTLNRGKEMEAMFKKLKFSRNNECEADLKGFQLMAKTNYNPKEAVNAMALLKNAEHEKYKDSLDLKKIFENDGFVLSAKALMTDKAPRPVKPKKKPRLKKGEKREEDEESTHPAIEKRVEALTTAMKAIKKPGTLQFLFTDSTGFAKIKATADFEIVTANYTNANYPKALYQSLEMQKYYPENEYLQMVACNSLSWISTYKAIESLPNILETYSGVADKPYAKLLYMLDKIKQKDLYTLSLNYSSKQNKKFKNNEDIMVAMGQIAEQKDGLEKARKYYELYLDKYPFGKHAHYVNSKLSEL